MKYYIAFIVLLVSPYLSAQEPELHDGSIMKYLSEVEMGLYFHEEVEKAGMHPARIAAHSDPDKNELTFTVPIGIQARGDNPTPQAWVGELSCKISAHYAHKTEWNPGQVVVKAKSSGDCWYTHYSGEKPPTIQWNLFQVVTDGEDRVSKSHVQHGLKVNWWANNTSAYLEGCQDRRYLNWNAMVVTVPPPFTINYGGNTTWWEADSSVNEVFC